MADRSLVPSRERAQALILAGRVLVNEQKITKPGRAVDEASALRLLGDDLRYVSRGGLKLEGALEHWQIDLTGRFCLDVGTSTGGFTDCMLQHGATRVLAVDTGYGQIAERLRVGMTAINGVITFAGVPSLPFGGIGDSGFGFVVEAGQLSAGLDHEY